MRERLCVQLRSQTTYWCFYPHKRFYRRLKSITYKPTLQCDVAIFKTYLETYYWEFSGEKDFLLPIGVAKTSRSNFLHKARPRYTFRL
jgi:hypothetical protein